jgi:hypothetical protein
VPKGKKVNNIYSPDFLAPSKNHWELIWRRRLGRYSIGMQRRKSRLRNGIKIVYVEGKK